MSLIVSETKDAGFQLLAGGASFLYPSYTIGKIFTLLLALNVLQSGLLQENN